MLLISCNISVALECLNFYRYFLHHTACNSYLTEAEVDIFDALPKLSFSLLFLIPLKTTHIQKHSFSKLSSMTTMIREHGSRQAGIALEQ